LLRPLQRISRLHAAAEAIDHVVADADRPECRPGVPGEYPTARFEHCVADFVIACLYVNRADLALVAGLYLSANVLLVERLPAPLNLFAAQSGMSHRQPALLP